MSESEQESYLAGLLPPGKRVGTISAYLLASDQREVNQRTVCSGRDSGEARPDYSGSDTFHVNTSSDAVCRQLHDVRNETVLEIDNTGSPQTGHLIFLSCTSGFSKAQRARIAETMGAGAVFMHEHHCSMQEGPVVHVARGREKHGEWEIAVSTRQRLGGKAEVSEYDVTKVEAFEIASPAVP